MLQNVISFKIRKTKIPRRKLFHRRHDCVPRENTVIKNQSCNGFDANFNNPIKLTQLKVLFYYLYACEGQ